MQLIIDYLKKLTKLKPAGKINQGKEKSQSSIWNEENGCFRNGQLYVNVLESLDQTGNFLEKYSSHWLKTE